MSKGANRPDLAKRGFARTNSQTIAQRVAILRELLPATTSIAEFCCGDCSGQATAYADALGVKRFRGLDVTAEIVQQNRAKGIDCVQGNVLDEKVLRGFLDFDVVFFGPPLSTDCDGHRLHRYGDVEPSFAAFTTLFLAALSYQGTLVCICPKSTTLGDVQTLYSHVRSLRPDVNLRLVQHSYSTVTGAGEVTEPRLKYVDVWLSSHLPDAWEIR